MSTYDRTRPELVRHARRMAKRLTVPEARLRDALSARYGCLFEPQWALGEVVIDFYCPVLNFAIEVDGPSHRQVLTAARDGLQERLVAEVGGRTLRFTNERVMGDLEEVLREIHVTLLDITPDVFPKGTKHRWRMGRKLHRALTAEKANSTA